MAKQKKTILERLKLKANYFDTQNGISDDVLIQIRNITKNYKSKRVLKGINLTIKKGEHIAILGPNGAGKTTLTEIIATIKEPTNGRIYYSFGKKKKVITSNIGMQFQDSSYPPTYKVIDLVNFFVKSGKNHLTKADVEQFMKIFNLWKFKSYHADSLSGGQRQRLNILLSLINSPKLLILDELSTGLDIDSVERVQRYILDYVNKNDITLILVSHNPEEVKTLTNRIIMLDHGIVFQDQKIEEVEQRYGGVEQYLYDFFNQKAKDRKHYDIAEDFDFHAFKRKNPPRTNLEFLIDLENRRIHNAREQIRFLKWKRSLEFERIYQEELEVKAQRKDRHLSNPDLNIGRKNIMLDYVDDSGVEEDDFLKVTGIKKSYGRKEVLKGIDFTIKNNERVAIIGANGAGKTTLTEIIATIKEPSSGKIYYSFGKNKYDITANIGMQFQDVSYPVMYTVKNLIYFFARANHTSMSTYQIHQALKIFNLYKFRNHIAESLSGGQKQRLNVLITLIKNPKLLILDEVSTGLDIEAVEEIKRFILTYINENDATLILVSHNIKEIADMTDRIIALKDGEVYKDVFLEDIKKEYNVKRGYDAVKMLTEELFEDELEGILENDELKRSKKSKTSSSLIIDNFESSPSIIPEENTYELKDLLETKEVKKIRKQTKSKQKPEFETLQLTQFQTIEEVSESMNDDHDAIELVSDLSNESMNLNEIIFVNKKSSPMKEPKVKHSKSKLDPSLEPIDYRKHGTYEIVELGNSELESTLETLAEIEALTDELDDSLKPIDYRKHGTSEIVEIEDNEDTEDYLLESTFETTELNKVVSEALSNDKNIDSNKFISKGKQDYSDDILLEEELFIDEPTEEFEPEIDRSNETSDHREIELKKPKSSNQVFVYERRNLKRPMREVKFEHHLDRRRAIRVQYDIRHGTHVAGSGIEYQTKISVPVKEKPLDKEHLSSNIDSLKNVEPKKDISLLIESNPKLDKQLVNNGINTHVEEGFNSKQDELKNESPNSSIKVESNSQVNENLNENKVKPDSDQHRLDEKSLKVNNDKKTENSFKQTDNSLKSATPKAQNAIEVYDKSNQPSKKDKKADKIKANKEQKLEDKNFKENYQAKSTKHWKKKK